MGASRWLLLLAMIVTGCSNEPKLVQLSGKVTFKGKPVPAGYITLTPDVASGTLGQTVGFQIENGAYDSNKETPPGIGPGVYKVMIAGFDGKKIPMFGQGKQIFNPIEQQLTVSEGTVTQDFTIPESAGENVRIQPTADS